MLIIYTLQITQRWSALLTQENIRSWWRTYPLNNKTLKNNLIKKLRALPKIAHKLGMCTVSLTSINLITLVDTKISAYSYITSHM